MNLEMTIDDCDNAFKSSNVIASASGVAAFSNNNGNTWSLTTAATVYAMNGANIYAGQWTGV